MGRYRRHHRRAWSRWIEWNRGRLEACGIPSEVFQDPDRWNSFIEHGTVRHEGRHTLLALGWLSTSQLRRLHQFLEDHFRYDWGEPPFLLRTLRQRFAGAAGTDTARGPDTQTDAVTEGAWLTTSDPERMLQQLQGEGYTRKLRLFSLACCRRVYDAIPDDNSRNALAVLERCADGLGWEEELQDAMEKASRGEIGATSGPARAAARAVSVAWSNPEHARSAAATAAVRADIERSVQADLLREIAGNPFHTVAVEQAWLRSNEGLVSQIAQTIYDEGRFDEMPILGDALAEAGCQDKAILDHCRRSRGHVRGCWVLDSLLGVPLETWLWPRETRFWSLKKVVEEEGRFDCEATCLGGYAGVSLLVEPVEGNRPVLFRNTAGKEAGPWLPAVKDSVRHVLREQADKGIRLRGVRVTLTAVQTQPIESRGPAFEQATTAAMRQAIEHAGLASRD